MEPDGFRVEEQATAAASTTTAPATPDEATASRRPTPPAETTENASLLRTWGDDGEIPPSPPVASLVVENSGGSIQETGYPVATFVRDWVRTSIGAAVRTSGSASTPATAETLLPLSVRSESELPSRPQLNDSQFYSAPAAVNLENSDAEFIIVGGEMIHAPTSSSVNEAPNHLQQEFMENMIRNQLRSEDCMVRPKKMKTRIQNKITKIFHRGRKRNTQSSEDMTTDNLNRNSSLDSASVEFPPGVATVPSAAASVPTTSLESNTAPATAEGSTKPAPKNNNRKAIMAVNLFRRRAQSSETDLSGEQPARTSQTDSIVDQFNSLPPLASMEEFNFPQSERSLHPSAYHHDSLSSLDHPFLPRNEQGLMPSPPRQPFFPHTAAEARAQSVTASYLGTAEEFNAAEDFHSSDAGVAAASFVEPDNDMSHLKKSDDDYYCLPMSLVAEQADLKVDKADAPEVEDMLRRAMIEASTDLVEHEEEDVLFLKPESEYREKTDYDEDNTNDRLKVVMVAAPSVNKSSLARWLRGKESRKKSSTRTLKLSAENWALDTVTCRVFDVQGHNDPHAPNFGAHPGTQAMFFSPNTLYLLVWDLGVRNIQLQNLRQSSADMEYDSDFEDDDDDDRSQEMFLDFDREEAKNEADRALRADINNRVLSWFDCIAQRGPRSAILPVVLVSEQMTSKEVEHRRKVLQQVLEEHNKNKYNIHRDPDAPKLLMGADNMILAVNDFGDKEGILELQSWIKAMANDETRFVFDHVGSPFPCGTGRVREAIRKFQSDQHKLVLLDHFMAELSDDPDLDVKVIIQCLHFLASIGEILYFGSYHGNDVLSRFVILSHTWLVSALSCILRNDLEHELAKERRFMNMQCIYSDQRYEEHDVIRVFRNSTSSCPLLSNSDVQMLWQSHNFMREASDQYSQLVETSTPPPTVFNFLERLLEYSGVLLPLGVSQDSASLQQSEVYFVPSLLTQADPHNLWTYKHAEAYLTTLCHSWLFRDGAPPDLMERITVNLLRDFFNFTRTFPTHPAVPARSHSLHVGKSFGDFNDMHDGEVLGRVRIHHVLCFKCTVVIKVGTVFADSSSDELRESFAELFVALVDQNSQNAVASDVMKPTMQRVVVSGKGPAGHNGKKLWCGGYEVALDSVRKTLADMSNVDSQVVCPQCLASSNPRGASTWGWDSVLAAARSGGPSVICLKGHRVNSKLVCGICNEKKPPPTSIDSSDRHMRVVNIQETLPSVVLVCVWDPDTKKVIGSGSGFILDRRLGLIVTAGHVMFSLDVQSKVFGVPYFGYENARALIGVIPEDGGSQASFRYFADLVAHDPRNVDACILQIRSRLKEDISVVNGFERSKGLEESAPVSDMLAEELKSLKMTKHFSLEENIRVAGYNQGGEGIKERGRHVSGSADIANGFICRHFKSGMCDDSFSSDSSSSHNKDTFSPREEIVVMCSTIPGHSGGPFVNSEGKVVGILSRSDSVEQNRCYLVPATEIKPLSMRARSMCTKPAKHMLMSTQTL